MMGSSAIELQEKILAAQAAQAALVESVSTLEKEVADLKAWDAEKKRYTLADIGNGALAYEVKEDARGTEPQHRLCANCYHDGHKSILQPETVIPGMWHVFVCHRCSAVLWPHGGGRSNALAPKTQGRR